MAKSDFDAFVKRQQTKEEEEAAALDPQQALQQWLGYLDALYKQITKFLESYIQNGFTKIDYRNIELNEDFIGPYLGYLAI